jgi:GNAT superfamily N-acetyltransferase
MNKFTVSPDIVEKWLKAWSLSRQLPLPAKYKSGFKVDVGYKRQRSRYVFPELNEDFVLLSREIKEPWIFLKVCASKIAVGELISNNWQLQPPGNMMYCFGAMKLQSRVLGNDYKLEIENYNSTYVVRIVTQSGALASIGRLVIVEDLAAYDRISTQPHHRRKGLATYLMRELEKIAVSKKVVNNFLVATNEGKLLYESLGWELYSLYTSMVIADSF